MMKKRVLSMLMVMIMMVSMLSVSVFAVDHTGHTVATDWSYDPTGHWHACSDVACTALEAAEQTDYAAHTFDNTHKCTECDYQGTHSWVSDDNQALCACGAGHSHKENLNWVVSDPDSHWQVCKNCPVDANKQYSKAAHEWTKNDDETTTNVVEYLCVCGAKKAVHEHQWSSALVNTDADNHYYVCELGCGETKDSAAHNWVKQDTSTATNIAYKCSVCGATKNEHVHDWSSSWSESATHHWHACKDPSCTAVADKAEHFDTTSNGNCDDCTVDVASVAHTTLTITGLTEPTNGAAVDFTVDIAEGNEYGKTTVKWNRVTKLSDNASVALGTSNTFSSGEMYNTSITVLTGGCDTFDNFTITLNGKNVPFYKTYAAFEAAVKTYEGDKTVYMAYRGMENGETFIRVCAMYAKLSGTHTHSFGSEWIETPAKHYYMCTGCGETKDTEYHYDNNDSGLCDVCGFDMKYFNKNATASTTGSGTTTHTHTYSTDWVEDISNHWKQCTGCGAKTSLAAHADLNNTGKCDLCGFVMTAAAGHTHTFATEWTETFAQHYKVCSCGAKNEIAAHVDLNNTGKCDTCGYAMTTLSNNGIVADTGDHNATFLWMAAFALSAVGAAATVLFARKKREE